MTTPTNAQGRASLPTSIPDDVTLIGGHLFTQYWCLDPGANANSLTFSNGLDTRVGGNQ